MKRVIAGISAVAVAFSLLCAGTAKADGEGADTGKKTLASMDYIYAGEDDAEPDSYDLSATKYGDKESGYAFTTGSAKLFASVTGDKLKSMEWAVDDVENEAGVLVEQICPVYKMDGTKEYAPVMAATKKNPWTEGTVPYFEIQFSTKGYKDVAFSAYVGATKKGPRDYQLAYAIGESEKYTVATGAEAKISLAANKTLTQICDTLPEEANDQELVKVRVQLASMETVSSTADAPVYLYDNPTGGEAAINHISITGVDQSWVPTTVPAATNPPQTTATASPDQPKASALPSPTVQPTDKPQTTVKVKKLKLNKKKLTLKKGKKYTLKLTITSTAKTAKEKKALKKAVKWTSSNKKVASVTKSGKVTAKKVGKAKITAKLKGKKVSCTVKVKKR